MTTNSDAEESDPDPRKHVDPERKPETADDEEDAAEEVVDHEDPEAVDEAEGDGYEDRHLDAEDEANPDDHRDEPPNNG